MPNAKTVQVGVCGFCNIGCATHATCYHIFKANANMLESFWMHQVPGLSCHKFTFQQEHDLDKLPAFFPWPFCTVTL